MGLYDREYIRDRPGGSPGFGAGVPRLSRWSVNTWLIVINIAVYVSQYVIFLPTFGVVEVNLGDRFYSDTTSEQMGRAQPIGDLRPSQGDVPFPVYQLVDPTTNRPIGERPVIGMEPLQAAGHFSTLKTIYRFELWRFVSFQFLHADTTHLFFNMLMLLPWHEASRPEAHYSGIPAGHAPYP